MEKTYVDKNEVIRKLDQLIIECKEQEELFKLRGMNTSELCSQSMKIAYQSCKEIILKS
jgi:hypothetical protein